MAETEESENVWWAAPRFLMSAVAVLLLVIVGIILFIWIGNDDDSDAAQPAQTQTAAPTPSASATASASDESVCGLDAIGGTTLTSAPEDVEWEFLGGIAAPTSTEHGPGVVDEMTGVRSCYSHTPEGALMAVTGMLAASGDTELLLETTRALVLDGVGKQSTLEGLEQRVSTGGTSTVPIEVAGFRLLSYSTDQATVEVVLAGDSGDGKVYQTTSANIVWKDGDWYFELEDDGSGGPVDGQISDLSGYVPWGPNIG